jgi:hypothetical protein
MDSLGIISIAIAAGGTLIGVSRYIHNMIHSIEKDLDKRMDLIEKELEIMGSEVKHGLAKHDAWLSTLQGTVEVERQKTGAAQESWRNELNAFEKAAMMQLTISTKEIEQELRQRDRKLNSMELFLAKELSFQIRQE